MWLGGNFIGMQDAAAQVPSHQGFAEHWILNSLYCLLCMLCRLAFCVCGKLTAIFQPNTILLMWDSGNMWFSVWETETTSLIKLYLAASGTWTILCEDTKKKKKTWRVKSLGVCMSMCVSVCLPLSVCSCVSTCLFVFKHTTNFVWYSRFVWVEKCKAYIHTVVPVHLKCIILSPHIPKLLYNKPKAWLSETFPPFCSLLLPSAPRNTFGFTTGPGGHCFFTSLSVTAWRLFLQNL